MNPGPTTKLLDPEVRSEGLCALDGCGKRRGLSVPASLSRYGRERLTEMLMADPFCCSAHAREWHGQSLPATEPGGFSPKYAGPDT